MRNDLQISIPVFEIFAYANALYNISVEKENKLEAWNNRRRTGFKNQY